MTRRGHMTPEEYQRALRGVLPVDPAADARFEAWRSSRLRYDERDFARPGYKIPPNQPSRHRGADPVTMARGIDGHERRSDGSVGAAVAGAHMVEFVVPGVPVAKGRPRATTVGGPARLYTPAKTRAFEAHVAACAVRAARGVVFSGPVELAVTAAMPRPKSRRKDKWHATRPDLDNIVKAVADGCCDLWRDDAQIVRIKAQKRYVLTDETPCVYVRISEVE